MPMCFMTGLLGGKAQNFQFGSVHAAVNNLLLTDSER